MARTDRHAPSVSEKIVRNSITIIFAKLEVENRAQAIVRALKTRFGRE
jgi:DNA-binding NarL/FixJ family response regulator